MPTTHHKLKNLLLKDMPAYTTGSLSVAGDSPERSRSPTFPNGCRILVPGPTDQFKHAECRKNHTSITRPKWG